MAARIDSSSTALPEPLPVPRTERVRSRLTVRERWLLVALLLGAALIRIAVIWMPSDQMLENGGLPFEEVLRGNAASDFQHGMVLPLLDYQLNHFSGGSLVMSILAVPLFLVAGPLFPVLRLVSLCFSIPLVLVTFLLVDRWKGRRAAWASAALLAFAPPGYQFLNCTVYGTHMEGNLLTIALVFLYLTWRKSKREGGIGTLCLGLFSGFAVWFGYGQCVVLGVLFLIELAASGRRAVLRSAPLFSLGFVVGLSPWIANSLRHPERTLHIYERSIIGHFGSEAYAEDKLAVLGNLFVVDGPRAFWFHGADESAGMLIAQVFFWASVLLFGCSLWIERRQIASFARALFGGDTHFQVSLRLISVLFISTWLCVFCLSDFRVESKLWILECRYLMPLFPFIAILGGVAVENSPTRMLRVLGTAAIVLVATVNAAGTIAQLRPDRLAEHARAPATSQAWHVRMIVRRFGNDGAAMQNILQRIDRKRPEPERAQFVDWIAKGIARIAASRSEHMIKGGIDTRPYARTLRFLVQHAPEAHRPLFVRQLEAQRDAAWQK